MATEPVFRFLTPPARCEILPDRTWQLECEVSFPPGEASFARRIQQGWRRSGMVLYRPLCPSCRACQSIRVPVASFAPDRSQRRVRKRNEGVVRLSIGRPSITEEKLALYDRFHAYQAVTRGWPSRTPGDADGYAMAFIHGPARAEEWRYSIEDRLVGVGYVDPIADGLSAVYFFHDPEERARSLGTWNVLSVIAGAGSRGLPYVYLGYYVQGCRSLAYKARFAPHQIMGPGRLWGDPRRA
jgi:arginine-tRNA-protein transferase